MIIRPLTNYNQTSFKAIKLNESEQKKSDNLMFALRGASEEKSDTVKFQLYEIYDKHLQKEVDLKCKGYHLKEDFSQEMFLKFFESLENIRKNIMPIEEFIPFLNNIKPSKNDTMTLVNERSIDQNINDSGLNIKYFLTNDNIPTYLSSKNEEERKIVKDELDKQMIGTDLKDVKKTILKDLSEGTSLKKMMNKLNLSSTAIYRHYHSALYQIQNTNDILPKEIEDFVSEFSNRYEIDSVERVKKAFSANPLLLRIDIEQIFKNIKDIAAMLEIPEKTFVMSGLKQPQLLVYKPESIQKNIKKNLKLFDMSKEEFIDAALKYPPLFYQKPETLNDNITKVSEIGGIEKADLIDLAKDFPCIFLLKPENTIKKIKLARFYRQVQSKSDDKLRFSADATDIIFHKTLSVLIKKSFPNNRISLKNFTDYIIANPDKTYEFDLPKNEVNEEFKQYVNDYFTKLIGKCNVKFSVKNDD